jgi:predicted HAD superfamily Cof-like phosphohydrolase
MFDDFKAELPVNIHTAVTKFQVAAGDTVDEFNSRQAARYTGMQCEELAEKLRRLASAAVPASAALLDLALMLEEHGERWKLGEFDAVVERAVISEDARADIIDADIDLAWVSFGSLNSLGTDVAGNVGEVAAKNLQKIGPNGLVYRDVNGKIAKPPGWTPPDHLPYMYPLPTPDVPPPRNSGLAELDD